MAKHRELAQIVYANTLGRRSASTIWRTVVVAGAMLGAPLAATAGDPPPAAKKEAPPATKPAPPPAKEAAKPVDGAKAAMPIDEPPPMDKASTAKLAKENVKALETEMKDLDKKIVATTKELKGAKDQAARDTANATLTDQRKQKDELKAKLTQAKADSKKADAEAKAEAKAKNPPRPRVQETRPKGRGFILS
jgi:hypothetical protein